MGNQASSKGDDPTYSSKEAPAPELTYTEEELKSRLSAEEYRVTQEKGREISNLIYCTHPEIIVKFEPIN
jgi:hypothetical protein